MTKPNIITRNESTDDIRHSFSKVVWFYDYWGKLTESKAQIKVLDYANISNGDTILEVAVGTGSLFKKIIAKNTDGLSIGIDLSPEMIKQARMKVQDVKKHGHYSLKIESAGNLSCESGSVDIILNNYMLDLLPETMFSTILNEFNRVLKPSGKLVITCMAFGNKWYHRFWTYLSRHFPKLLTYCRPVNLTKPLIEADFKIIKKTLISQNTFPSEIILAQKISEE